MSTFNGFIRKLNDFTGRMLEKALGLKVSISPIKPFDEAEITQIKPFSATWNKQDGFSGIMKPLSMVYRMIVAKVLVLMGLKAKASSSPAADMEADNIANEKTDVILSAQDAAEVAVDRKEKFSVFSKLVAYNRAAAVYISKIFTSCFGKVTTAPGKAAKYTEVLQMERTSKAEAADSAIMESRYNRFAASHEAMGTSATAENIAALWGVANGTEAAAIKANTQAVNAESSFGAAHGAKMATWIDPVVVDGVLILRQAYSATVENDVLVVR